MRDTAGAIVLFDVRVVPSVITLVDIRVVVGVTVLVNG